MMEVDTTVMIGETAFVQLGAGETHTCGRTARGIVWCWGGDEYGQLGAGGVSGDSQVPVPVDSSSL